MTGHKTLSEIRAELEAVLGAGPIDAGPIAESLRRFLAGGSEPGTTPHPAGDDSSSPPGRDTRPHRAVGSGR